VTPGSRNQVPFGVSTHVVVQPAEFLPPRCRRRPQRQVRRRRRAARGRRQAGGTAPDRTRLRARAPAVRQGRRRLGRRAHPPPGRLDHRAPRRRRDQEGRSRPHRPGRHRPAGGRAHGHPLRGCRQRRRPRHLAGRQRRDRRPAGRRPEQRRRRGQPRGRPAGRPRRRVCHARVAGLQPAQRPGDGDAAAGGHAAGAGPRRQSRHRDHRRQHAGRVRSAR
ncbi:unnamed protein product, partial [Didymodactylos carnosus]